MKKLKTKQQTMTFAEMRRLLDSLGYQEQLAENAHVFHRAREDYVIFRRYKPGEAVDEGDVVTTRDFLDASGILDEADFDAFFVQAATSA